MDLAALVLRIGHSHFISATTGEAAQAEIARLAGQPIDSAAFAAAIADLLHNGLIRDPIRLDAQALQCHWRLELTPQGVARVGRLTGA